MGNGWHRKADVTNRKTDCGHEAQRWAYDLASARILVGAALEANDRERKAIHLSSVALLFFFVVVLIIWTGGRAVR